MVIRLPTRVEITLLRRSFDKWGVFNYFENLALLLNQSGVTKMVCASTKELKEIAPLDKIAYHGLEIGELRKKFIPTIAGADLFVRVGCKKKYCVSVGDIGQELVLYGRDVMGDSVTYASEELSENEIVVLIGAGGHVIGVGRTRFGGSRLTDRGKVTITTLQDAGMYLREEGD